MADDENNGNSAETPAEAADTPEVAPRQFRSKQQTLAMGGNVNALYRQRMPTLREVAEEFVVDAPPRPSPIPKAEPEPTRLTEVAARTVRESSIPEEPQLKPAPVLVTKAVTAPPLPANAFAPNPTVDAPLPAGVPPLPPGAFSTARVATPASVGAPPLPADAFSAGFSAEVQPARAEPAASSVGSLPSVVRAETAPATTPEPGQAGSLDAASQVDSVSAEGERGAGASATGWPVVGPETFAAQVLRPPDIGPDFAGPATGLRGRWQALSVQQRRWASAAGALVLAAVFGFALGPLFDDGDPAASAVGDSNRVEESGTQSSVAVPSERGAAMLQPPVPTEAPAAKDREQPAQPQAEASAASTPAAADVDARFAVRKSETLPGCDEALGEPFEVEAKPHPGQAGAYWSRSRKSLMHGKTEQAVKEMCLAASWDLEGRATYGLSEYFFRASDFAQARAWAERVPQGSKRYRDSRATLGDILSQQGRTEAALGVYLEHWNIVAGDDAERREVAGRFVNSAAKALRKNDWWTAENLYRRAAILDPTSVLAAVGMSRVLLQDEHTGAALRWAEQAVKADPESVHAALALCEVYVTSKDASKAKAALERLQTLSPAHPRVNVLAKHLRELD